MRDRRETAGWTRVDESGPFGGVWRADGPSGLILRVIGPWPDRIEEAALESVVR